jgi:hypothetical protein
MGVSPKASYAQRHVLARYCWGGALNFGDCFACTLRHPSRSSLQGGQLEHSGHYHGALLLRRGTNSPHNLLKRGVSIPILCFHLEDDAITFNVFDDGIEKLVAFPGEVRSSTRRGNDRSIHFNLARPDDSGDYGF